MEREDYLWGAVVALSVWLLIFIFQGPPYCKIETVKEYRLDAPPKAI